MLRLFSLFTLILICFNGYGQIQFENGYYINNSGQKTEGLIKNLDWKNNPDEFQFKTTENESPKTLTIKSVKEFGINDVVKYLRVNTAIDRSSENYGEISADKNPVFLDEEFFLEVLIRGKASLYSYKDTGLKRFFYSEDSTDIEQLIYKSYKVSDNKIGKNNFYRQQLWVNLKCQSSSISDVEKVGYNRRDLIQYFINYNECSGSGYVNMEKGQKKGLFNLNLRAGLNSSSLKVENSIASRNVSFNNEFGIQLGIEAEFIMPFNKNKWALIIEPSYRFMNTEKEITYLETSTVSRSTNVVVDYRSIEALVGMRHYLFLNSTSKLFIDAGLVLDIPFSSTILSEREHIVDIKIVPNFSPSISMGYKYGKSYSASLKYSFARKNTEKSAAWDSNYSSIGLVFSYTLL